MKFDYKWMLMIEHFKNVPFTHDGFKFFLLEDSALLHDFESIQPTGVLFPCKDHSAEAAFPYDLNLFEIVGAYFLYSPFVLPKFYQ